MPIALGGSIAEAAQRQQPSAWRQGAAVTGERAAHWRRREWSAQAVAAVRGADGSGEASDDSYIPAVDRRSRRATGARSPGRQRRYGGAGATAGRAAALGTGEENPHRDDRRSSRFRAAAQQAHREGGADAGHAAPRSPRGGAAGGSSTLPHPSPGRLLEVRTQLLAAVLPLPHR